MIMDIKFTKMQAYGNDYVYVDAINQRIDDPNALALKISDRHFAVGSDGLVMLCEATVPEADFRMRMFNPDGSEGEMCGNALRSVSMFAYYYGFTKKEDLVMETLGGLQYVKLHVENGEVINITADIGCPRLKAAEVPVNTKLQEFINEEIKIADKTFRASSLSWGNPHTVIFVDDTDSFDVHKYGPLIEHATDIFPKKTNVTFAKVIDDKNIKMREWERGTGETIGCGTGCCTAAVYASILGLAGKHVDVEQIGGKLHVDWDDDGHVRMTGPSHVVFEGVYRYEA